MLDGSEANEKSCELFVLAQCAVIMDRKLQCCMQINLRLIDNSDGRTHLLYIYWDTSVGYIEERQRKRKGKWTDCVKLLQNYNKKQLLLDKIIYSKSFWMSLYMLCMCDALLLLYNDSPNTHKCVRSLSRKPERIVFMR